MSRHLVIALLAIICLAPAIIAQNLERIQVSKTDSSSYYLACKPRGQIKGAIFLLSSFAEPESLTSETKLHNIAFANNLLMIFAPVKGKLFADQSAISWINEMLSDIIRRYQVDSSKIAMAGYDEAGSVALRFTEQAWADPSHFPIRPSVVFGIDSQVDLFRLWQRSEAQIKKNFWPGAVGDARFYIDELTKEAGAIRLNEKRYDELTPFKMQIDSPGNERFLKNVAIRLYYDTDLEWQLRERMNSINDTNIPEGSELIKRLRMAGNSKAEFIAAKQPGVRSNGMRHPNALSIVDEVECVTWIKRSLDIFDASNWSPPYQFDLPQNWHTERFELPADFAPNMNFTGVEDIRFTKGWGDSTSTEYWSYAYLWWLKKGTVINEINLRKNLYDYYSGLVGRNITNRKIPAEKQVSPDVIIKKTKTLPGDLQTFEGKIAMLDYMQVKPIVLNLRIHEKECGNNSRIAVYLELSPQKYSGPVWEEFESLGKSFRCGN